MNKTESDFLKKYDHTVYEKPSVTTDIAICTIINDDLKVLLIRRKNPPFKDKWALPGGFVNIPDKESLEETAARELREETGLYGVFIEQLKTYGDPGRDPRLRVITVAYYALVSYDKLVSVHAGDDAAEAKWFSFKELPELAFDHDVVLRDVIYRIKGKISYTPIAFNLVPKEFTWKELQKVYEIILDRKFIVPDFRMGILNKYNIKVLDKRRIISGRGRPSKLLTLINEKKKGI